MPADLIHALAAHTSGHVTDKRGWQWRVKALSPAEALKAGLGLPHFGRLQKAVQAYRGADPEGPTAAAVRAQQEAILKAEAQNPATQAEVVEYHERVVMAAVTGIRLIDKDGEPAAEWDRVRIVSAGAEDAERQWLSIASIAPDLFKQIQDIALGKAHAAVGEVTSFREGE